MLKVNYCSIDPFLKAFGVLMMRLQSEEVSDEVRQALGDPCKRCESDAFEMVMGVHI